ncbi:MAG: hypothetical protein K2K39_01085 [Clostridia bacterium]|nr:hypothetical protein [Clostridia bacterium]
MKKGKSKFKALLGAVAALVLAVPCAASPVFANSAPRYEYGVTGSGALEINERSVLAVESEKLTFDVVDFPDYPDVGDYKSTVTAEYKFVNTSQATVHTQMAFPIGNDPNLYNASSPEISIDGCAAEVQTRYTYYRNGYNGDADFAKEVKKICDGWYDDGFYSPDLTVTKYTVSGETGRFDDVRLRGVVTCGDNARYTAQSLRNNEIYLYLDRNGYQRDFYVFGDTADFKCEWHVEEYVEHVFTAGEWVPCDRVTEVAETGRQSLKEFALQDRRMGSEVSEQDWFNAVVCDMGDKKAVENSPAFNTYFEDYFLAWYVYDVEIGAGESLVNTVTSPIYPRVWDGYKPAVYNYKYFLSPAAGWKSFGTLEVIVNTDYYLLDPPTAFEKVEGGYRAVYNGLPNGELELSVSTSANPEFHDVGRIVGIVFIVIFAVVCVAAPLAVIIWAIVYSVKTSEKKRKNTEG